MAVWNDTRDGNFEIYYKRDPTGNVTGIKNIDLEIPKEFSLSHNYPNPFNPATTIRFQIPRTAYVSLKIFDLLGQQIKTLVSETLPADEYELKWDAENLPSGVYFYRLQVRPIDSRQAADFAETKKLVLLK